VPGFLGGRFFRGGASPSADADMVAAGVRTASGNSGSLGDAPALVEFEVNVSAASGTSPTLSVTLEESNDGSTWSTVGAAVAPNAVGTSARAQRTVYKRLWRFAWAIGGTPLLYLLGTRARQGGGRR
jgi:hypothetical protein